MALKKCKECGHQVSTKAKTCPNCGYDLKADAENKSQAIGCLMMIIIAAALYLWVSSWETTESEPWNQTNNWSMAYAMMEDFVEDRLVAPSTAEFPGVFDGKQDHVTKSGNVYTINSYVDSENRMGGTMRTRFTGKIEQVDEDTWQLIELELQE